MNFFGSFSQISCVFFINFLSEFSVAKESPAEYIWVNQQLEHFFKYM